MVWDVIRILIQLFILVYVLTDLVLIIDDRKYQKLWNKEKAMRIKLEPDISKAKLCEYFVMFCLRNNCNVEF